MPAFLSYSAAEASYAPLVSVIVPAFNAERFVQQALQSALAQTYDPLEVIVVDDGSTDATGEIVEAVARDDARVRLLRQPNSGVAAARNRAIGVARGALIAPLDADDVWHPEKIERQVAAMARGGADVGFVYTWWISLSEEGLPGSLARPVVAEGNVYGALLHKNFLGPASTPLMRRAYVVEVGGYDESLRARGGQGAEDWALALRLAERYDFGAVPAYLTGYRQVADSMSRDAHAMGRSIELVLADVEARHPGLPPALLRRSYSQMASWIAAGHHLTGHDRDALRWAYRAARADPLSLLSGLGLIVGRSLTRLALGGRPERPPVRRPAPDPDLPPPFVWDAEHPTRPSYAPDRIGDADHNWTPWGGWKPYDVLSRWRWRRTLRKSWRPATQARPRVPEDAR